MCRQGAVYFEHCSGMQILSYHPHKFDKENVYIHCKPHPLPDTLQTLVSKL